MTEFVQSSRRPIPLRRRPDLVVREVQCEGRPLVVVKDPAGVRYFRLQREQFCLLESLDGRRSLDELRSELQSKFLGFRPTLREIQQSIAELHHLELVWSDRAGQGETLLRQARRRKRSQILRAIANPLYIRFPGLNLNRVLGMLDARVGWVFHPFCIVGVAALLGIALVLLVAQFDRFERSLPTAQRFFSADNLTLLWLSIGILKGVHELGHGTCCKHFGLSCHETGLALVVFSPCLYCDVSDSWMLPDKWRRIAIASAGMYVELAIAACALLLWCLSNPGWFNDFCFNIFMVGSVGTILFNGNPLLRYDGYYILADWLEVPNLREKTDAVLKRTVARWILGRELPPDGFLPQRHGLFYGFYALASTAYCWGLAVLLLLAFYRFAKPVGLAPATIPFALVAVGAAPTTWIVDLWRKLSPIWNKRANLRLAVRLVVAAVCAALVLWMPIPWPVTGPIRVEPRDLSHIYASSPGILRRDLRSPRKLGSSRSGPCSARGPSRSAAARAALDGSPVARNRAEGEQARRRPGGRAGLTASDRLCRPRSCRFAESTRTPHDSRAPRRASHRSIFRSWRARSESFGLTRSWMGTPLDTQNLGCFLNVGDHLCDLAPADSHVAIVSVQQAHRNEISVGDAVSLYLTQCPAHCFRGVVVDIEEYRGGTPSERPVETQPVGTRSTTLTGDATTATCYRARIVCDELPHDLVAGGGGIALGHTSPRDCRVDLERLATNFLIRSVAT